MHHEGVDSKIEDDHGVETNVTDLSIPNFLRKTASIMSSLLVLVT